MRCHLLSLLLLATCAGCFLDPSCQDECAGDRIRRCNYDCPSTNDITRLGECERIESFQDCEAGETCVMGLADNNDDGERGSPRCVETALEECDPGSLLRCNGATTYANCQRTSDNGAVWVTGGDICEDMPGGECHEVERGVTCVESPKQSCDPSTTPPACLDDGETLERCDGRGDDFALLRIACSNGCAAGAEACGAP